MDAAAKPGGEDACATVNAPTLEKGRQQAEATAREKTKNAPGRIFKVLSNYTDGLKAVTKAEDSVAFKAASSKLAATAGTAAGTVGGLAGGAGAAAGPLVTAITSSVLWLVGEALEYRRLVALRVETAKACRPIRVLAKVVGVLLENVAGNRLDNLQDTLEAQIGSLNRSRSRGAISDELYGARLDAAFDTLNIYEATRQVNPRAVGDAMIKAHDKLVLAIHSNNGQFEPIVEALSDLATNVEALKTAMNTKPKVAAE